MVPSAAGIPNFAGGETGRTRLDGFPRNGLYCRGKARNQHSAHEFPAFLRKGDAQKTDPGPDNQGHHYRERKIISGKQKFNHGVSFLSGTQCCKLIRYYMDIKIIISIYKMKGKDLLESFRGINSGGAFVSPYRQAEDNLGAI